MNDNILLKKAVYEQRKTNGWNEYLKSVFVSFGTGPSKSNLSGSNSSALSHTWKKRQQGQVIFCTGDIDLTEQELTLRGGCKS